MSIFFANSIQNTEIIQKGGSWMAYRKSMTDFEKEVRHALIDRNMTAADMCRELGIFQSYMSDILKGYRPAKKMREKIVNYLGLDPKWIDVE